MSAVKSDIISFKADSALMAALKGVPNRSEFIRSAVLAALENACPVCGGSGVLSVEQRHHFDRFLDDHSLKECEECHETHLVCETKPKKRAEKKALR